MVKKMLLFGLFGVSTILILLEHFINLEINNSKVLLFIMFVSASSFIVILGRIILKQEHRKFILLTSLVVGLLCAAVGFFTQNDNWKTQVILYQNLHLATRTVEFQMQDLGAFGYRKRTVERIKIIPFFDWIKEVRTSQLDKLTWKRLNQDVNELGLKGG